MQICVQVKNISTISNVYAFPFYVIVLTKTAILHKRSNNPRCCVIGGRDQTL